MIKASVLLHVVSKLGLINIQISYKLFILGILSILEDFSQVDSHILVLDLETANHVRNCELDLFVSFHLRHVFFSCNFIYISTQ